MECILNLMPSCYRLSNDLAKFRDKRTDSCLASIAVGSGTAHIAVSLVNCKAVSSPVRKSYCPLDRIVCG